MAFGVRLPPLARTALGFGLRAPAGNRLRLRAPRTRGAKIAESGARASLEDHGCGRDASTANQHRLQRHSYSSLSRTIRHACEGNSSPVLGKNSQSLFVLK